MHRACLFSYKRFTNMYISHHCRTRLRSFFSINVIYRWRQSAAVTHLKYVGIFQFGCIRLLLLEMKFQKRKIHSHPPNQSYHLQILHVLSLDVVKIALPWNRIFFGFLDLKYLEKHPHISLFTFIVECTWNHFIRMTGQNLWAKPRVRIPNSCRFISRCS